MGFAGATRGNNQTDWTTVGGEPDEVGAAGDAEVEGTVVAVVGVAAQRDDAIAIGRPCGIAVEGGSLRELLRSATRRGHFPDLAAAGGPGDVGDRFSVRRPDRLKFLGVAGGEALRLSAGNVHNVKTRQGRECQFFAVGRFHGVLNQTNLDRPFFDLLWEIELGAKILRNLRGEGNQFFFAGRDVQAMKFPVVGVDDFLAAGEKRVAGEKIARKAGFLIVARDGIFHPAVLAGLEIAQAQPALGFAAGHVQKRGAVGRENGTHAAAELIDQNIFVAGFAVAPRDLPERELRFVSEAAHAMRVVKVFSIGGSGDAEVVELLAAAYRGRGLGFGDLHARTALDVVHPDFKRVDAEARFGNQNVLTVGGPVGRSKFRIRILGDLFRLEI